MKVGLEERGVEVEGRVGGEKGEGLEVGLDYSVGGYEGRVGEERVTG